ncbi:CHAT domain-containing protein [Streptomyces sp. NBC_00414]|uniref:CHAT domain-containing protein n=1 Tax=Streptomyces sp. NBC_00414 TaxID=2975739 RepID=UPI002E1B795E
MRVLPTEAIAILDPVRRGAVIGERPDLVADAAACLEEANHADDAVRILEHARAILLSQFFDDLDPGVRAALAADGAQGRELLTRHFAARQRLADELRAGYSADRGANAPAFRTRLGAWTLPYTNTLEQARNEAARARKAIDERTSGRRPARATTRRRNTPTLILGRVRARLPPDPIVRFETLREIADVHGPLVYVAAAERDGRAFIVTGAHRPVTVRLPEIGTGMARRLRDSMDSAEPAAALDFSEIAAPAREAWQWLRQGLQPLADALRSVMGDGLPLSLVPLGVLGWLPLHTALASQLGNSRATYGWPAIRYLPSARALGQTRPPGPEGFLAIEAAGSDQSPAPLRFGAQQCRWLCDLYGNATLPILRATRGRVLEQLPKADVCHLHCHGRGTANDPLDNSLVMTDGQLTVRDLILNGAVRAQLVVLSACNGQQGDRTQPDEAMGLPGSLIQAGAAAVVAPMWPVSEIPTVLLLREFHRARAAGVAGPLALVEAQRWISTATRADLAASHPDIFHRALALTNKTERIYADPENWAAFVYIGS